jgi:hypothetical protein
MYLPRTSGTACLELLPFGEILTSMEMDAVPTLNQVLLI